jgi:hypothetical protein
MFVNVPNTGRFEVAGTNVQTDNNNQQTALASTTLGTKLAGEDLTNDVMKVEARFTYFHISTNTTTVCKSTSGYLKSITINNPGASETVTVYDNSAASGSIIAVIVPTVTCTLWFEDNLLTGLTIVTAGTTPCDITVNAR